MAALDAEDAQGRRLIVVDAIRDEDLVAIGQAARNLPLVTGGSGVALGLPANFGLAAAPASWTAQPGKAVILSGSCSVATRSQVARHKERYPSMEIDAAAVIEDKVTATDIADWLLAQDGIPMAYSSADPGIVADIQDRFGRETAAGSIEALFAEVARQLVAGGVTRLITAGGETSGAVVEGLSLETLEIGPEIDPGVPALRAGERLVIALKSGNFGAEDFFEKAARQLGGDA